MSWGAPHPAQCGQSASCLMTPHSSLVVVKNKGFLGTAERVLFQTLRASSSSSIKWVF